MLNPATQAAIEHAVKTTLAPLYVLGVSVQEGENYDADDVLLVTVNLLEKAGQVPGDRMLTMMGAVSEAVLKLGDQRPPYVRTFRSGEAVPDEEADTAA